MEQQNYSSNASLIKVIQFVKKWWKFLFIVGIVVFIASVALSFLITPRFKSTAVLMTPATSSLSRPLFTQGYYKEDYLEYGIEKDCEYMMQILKSADLANKTIDHFDLYSHWQIKENDPKRYSKAYKKFQKEVKIKRTENLAVEVSVEDKDPQMASDIVNYLIEQYDLLRNDMKRERGSVARQIACETRDLMKQEMQFWEDSLQVLRAEGVMNYDDFTDRMYQEMGKQLAAGNQAAVKRIEERMQKYAQLGGSYKDITEYLLFKREQLADLETRIVQLNSDAEMDIPYKFIVSNALPSDAKVYPKRLNLAIVLTISTLLFVVLCLFFIEKWNRLKSEMKDTSL